MLLRALQNGYYKNIYFMLLEKINKIHVYSINGEMLFAHIMV